MPQISLRRMSRLAGALVVAAGLAVGVGMGPETRPAVAAPGTPILLSAEATSPTTIRVQFRDTADDEEWLEIKHVGPTDSLGSWIVSEMSGRGQEVARELGGFAPNTEYCFQMIAFDQGGLFDFGGHSDLWSGVKCATTPPEPAPSRAVELVSSGRASLGGVANPSAAVLRPPASTQGSIAAPLPPGLRERPQPAAPTNFTGTLMESDTRILLSWTGSEGATRYELRGSSQDGSSFLEETLSKDTIMYADEIGAGQGWILFYELRACALTCSAPVTATIVVVR